MVDAFDVTGDGSAPPPTTTRIEEDDPAISYTGDWVQVCDPRASGGCAEEFWDAGGRATLSFTGTAVRWIGWRNAGGGIARVFVDGTFAGEVDTLGTSTEPQAVMFTAADLLPGAHTLTIEVTGTANPDSDSTVIIIDAFDVTS